MYLAALELTDGRDWGGRVASALTGLDVCSQQRGNGFIIWSSSGRRSRIASIEYDEGFEVRRIWIAPQRHGLSISPRRLYFEPGDVTPLSKQEWAVLGRQRRPAGPPDKELLVRCLDMLRGLQSAGLSGVDDLVSVRGSDWNPLDDCYLAIGQTKHRFGATSLNSLYRDLGFDIVPDGFGVCVVCCPGVDAETGSAVAARLRSAMSQRGVSPYTTVVRFERIRSRLEQLESAGVRPTARNLIPLFVLPCPDSDLPHKVSDIMRKLDDFELPWRRSYGTDPLEYSLPDQLPSLLQASGGVQHRVLLNAEHSIPWSLGIDLSHARGQRHSTLCAALVDGSGNLVRAWTFRQRRDETVGMVGLRRLLRAATEVVSSEIGDRRLVVLRDGRLFENENARLYREALGVDVSLIECRKRGNPQLFELHGQDVVLPLHPAWARVDDAYVGFLVTNPQRSRKALDQVLKISWQATWNGLSLAPEDIARILVALTLSPGLGLHRRTLPAPLYWADGIAGASDDDLRFRGQKVTQLS